MHSNLIGTDDPSGLGGGDQQAKIDYREKQNRIWYIMFEKPDHCVRLPTMSEFLTVKGKVSLNFTLLN
jgi:hypothetical protein